MTELALVLNGGSSSLKYQVLQPESGDIAAAGIVERIGQPGEAADHDVALGIVRREIAEAGVDLTANPPRVIGHRVVHGGNRFREPTLVTPDVIDAIRDLAPLAPLHNPANAALLASARAAFPDVVQVAVFDTAFFAALPEVAATYAIDREIARRHHVRRYGFHGISHQYVSRRAAALLGRPYGELRQIVLHLGNGASAAAIERGRPIDTSMGLTPLEGLVMGTRGGDIDPGVLIHLMRAAALDADGLEDLLTRRSGMKGLTGSVDLRDVHRQIADGGPGAADAALALDIYTHRLRKYIGAYFALLGHVDALVFTAGVGENDATIRAAATEGLGGLGISVDPERNTTSPTDVGSPPQGRVISPDGAPVSVLVVPTNEELEIARQSVALLEPGPARGRQ